MDSLFSIILPENFDFSDFANWPNWIRRCADDILGTLGLSAADLKKYKAVKEAFDKYFICKYNVIYGLFQ